MRRLSMAAALLALLTPAFAASGDFAGRWQIDGMVGEDKLDPICTLSIAEEKVTGTCTGLDNKPVSITGKVTGSTVVWSYPGELAGNALTMIYTATLKDERTMLGTFQIDPFGVGGNFTATRIAETAGEG